MEVKKKWYKNCLIILFHLNLYGGGLTVYNSLFISRPIYASINLLNLGSSLVADDASIGGVIHFFVE